MGDFGSEHLRLLLQSSTLLNSTLSLDGVLSYLLRQTLTIVGAQSGCILRLREGEWEVVCASSDGDPPIYSRTILERMVEEDDTLCLLDAQQDESFGPTSSVAASNLRSVLCSPLSWLGQIRGAIYLDHRMNEGVFQDEHTQLVEALGRQASIALENAALHEERERLHQSAMKQAIGELADAQAELFHAHELTGALAHAVVNPITEIGTGLEALARYAPDSVLEELEKLQGQVGLLQQMTEQFLHFTALDDSHWTYFSLSDVVNSTLEARFPGGESFKVEPELEPVHVYGDAKALGQALLKLLDNAVEAMAESQEPKLKVRSFTCPEQGVGCIEVTDNGPGLDADALARAFHPFFSTREKDSHPGLGLPLARSVLYRQARIELDSGAGSGTRATIRYLAAL